MKRVRKLPPQTPECVRDAAIVLKVHPAAEAFYDRERDVVSIMVHDMPALGIGCTAEVAWQDAARNVTRPPISPLPPMGSPTMSLRSDEVFWKGKRHAEAIS